jgi:iron complex outermembrane receptor protein
MKGVHFNQMLGVSALALIMAAAALPANAQTTDKTKSSDDEFVLEEIVVTARKRAEDILKTPVSVTAVTSEQLEQRGIATVSNLAEQTPGFNINNNSSGRADRSFQQLILRGFTPATTDSTPVATFIDGVPVSSATAVMSITNPERIELLRGPQSAYFGRNTFAGALNVVNKEPGDKFGGSVTASIAQNNNYRLQGELEAPIVEDKVSFRVSGSKYAKDGSFKNGANPGETLGDQSNYTYNGLLVVKPSENLTIKAFGMASHDDDGPAAMGVIGAGQVTDAKGNVVVANQSNCGFTVTNALFGITSTNRFICGTTPSLSSLSPASNTLVDSYVRSALAVTNNRLIDPEDGVQGYGLVRDYQHYHIAADYEIPDSAFTLTSLTGINREQWSSLSDIVNYDSSGIVNTEYTATNGYRDYYSSSYLVESKSKDFSQELRVGYDDQGALRFVVGANYLNASARRTVSVLDDIIDNNSVNPSGKTRNETVSGFFGVTYDITDKLTASVEGRYQIDKLYAYVSPTADVVVTDDTFIAAGTYKAGSLLASKKYENFLPRLIAQYQWTDEMMTYASVAKGVNPAALNSGVVNYTGETAAYAKNLGLDVFVEPEKVTTWEAGLKGTADGGRLRYTFAAYFSQWRNQLNQVIQTFGTSGGRLVSVWGTLNAGGSDMKGLEFDGSYRLNHLITLNAAGSINDSKIKSYNSPLTTQLTGISDFSGNELPSTSKYSASAGVLFNGDLDLWQDGTWFTRVDYNYKSGMWSDVANIVKTQASHVVNLRAGVTKGDISLDVFVNNLFNEDAYTSITDNYIFSPTTTYAAYNAINVGLREERTVGVQVKVKF